MSAHEFQLETPGSVFGTIVRIPPRTADVSRRPESLASLHFVNLHRTTGIREVGSGTERSDTGTEQAAVQASGREHSYQRAISASSTSSTTLSGWPSAGNGSAVTGSTGTSHSPSFSSHSSCVLLRLPRRKSVPKFPTAAFEVKYISERWEVSTGVVSVVSSGCFEWLTSRKARRKREIRIDVTLETLSATARVIHLARKVHTGRQNRLLRCRPAD